MYPILLASHNIIRWIALILGIVLVALSFIGWFGKREWTSRNRRWGMFFSSAMDVQLLLGLLLYIFFSPITRAAFQNLAAAMGNPGMRFFALEHAFYMLLAVIFAHLGSALSRRADDDVTKYRRAAIWYGLSVLLLFLGMPWGRPLFPSF